MNEELKAIRKDFPQLATKIRGQNLVYLDSAATSLKPQSVIDTITRFYSFETSNIHRGAHYLGDQATTKYEEAREKTAAFVNARSSSEIVFTRGTTEGINMVAASYGGDFLKEGDEIVLTQMEHHSNIVPWQRLAEQNGLVLRVVPVNEKGELLFEEYKKLLNSRTKIVALTHCSNTLGTLNPVQRFTAEAHKAGAVVLVDAAQSVPVMPVDVQDINCDFLVFSGHKIYGPSGVGVLYGKKELLDKMPPYQSGGSMIDQVSWEGTTYLDPPYRFEAGTTHVAGVIGLGAALDYAQAIGLEKTFEYKKKLLTDATQALAQIEGLRIIGSADAKTSIISFLVDGTHPSDIGSLLDQQGIALRTGHHCTQPLMDEFNITGTIRASFTIYNTEEDIERLKQGIDKAKELLG